MAGPNVIAAYYGGTGRNTILSQTATGGAAEAEFKIGNDAALTTVIAVLSMPTQSLIQGSFTPNDQATNPAILNAGFNRTGYQFDSNPPYNSGMFDTSKPFLVRVAGVATPVSDASGALTIALYLGTTKAGTKIATTSAVTLASSTTATGFLLEAQLKWDVTSTKVRGQFWWDCPGTTGTDYVTWAKLSSVAGTAAAVANLQFCATATWGGTTAGNVAAVSEFSVSQL